MVDYTALAGSLDLFELMVNYVAGGILLSLLIWALILMITGIMGRMSMPSIIVILVTYIVAVGIGYVGAIAGIFVFIGSLSYMIKGLLNWIGEIR